MENMTLVQHVMVELRETPYRQCMGTSSISPWLYHKPVVIYRSMVICMKSIDGNVIKTHYG